LIALHEATVAGRFDALEGRFKAEVAADDARLLAIVEKLSPLEGRLILDVGCGKGRFARRLQDRGARVIGLDASGGMLAGGAGDFVRVRATARRLPFHPATFDAAMAVEIFEHLATEALDQVCREVQRVLKPGGTFVVIDKNACSVDARRPWLPSVAVKWIDERRGRFMYSHRDRVRERWFLPWRLARQLRRWFPEVHVRHLLARDERGRFPFEWVPATRLLVLWAAKAPGGSF
jgi:2-polyprenyl-6-hydroxyphenyl methylase/3-demethylubiquinone-9 3-methyltransferase